MIYGVIYRYVSPSGKSYIGQTTDEKMRRKCFRLTAYYSGSRFDNAIKKYGIQNFRYEVLLKKAYPSIAEAVNELNAKEREFITLYDSYNNGYNMTLGGEGVRGYRLIGKSKDAMIQHLKEYYKTHENPFKGKKHSNETRTLLSKYAKNRVGENAPMYGKHLSNAQKENLSKYAKTRIGNKNPFFGKKHTIETKRKVSEANSKPVVQIDIQTGLIIAEFDSALEAGKSLGNPRINSEIIKCCRNYVSPTGRHYITCKGYKWKYK